MLLNLEARGCPLLGISATPTLDAQRRRFTDAGWDRAQAHDMAHVYRCVCVCVCVCVGGGVGAAA